ncbi:uncharacterized protein MAL13P1.304-like isoform X2 [Adelges cooleyi]|uniref:uncharacterized protein MAL13P1.304-like isoform X2 n=1 Tax=Adelges cooleyi TaxID=133065 RepID=UPI0021808A66|nr:uncharacterized protein MAL13P1.304-like isoform X2 [Adelges cooleyi]
MTMWSSTNQKINNTTIFYSFTLENNFYYFKFTNLVKYWEKSSQESLFSSLYTDEIIETEPKTICEYLANIEKKSSLDWSFVEKESNLNVGLSINLSDGFCINLEFDVELKNSEHFYKNITMALLMTIKSLNNNQDNLISLIKKKDEEIKEYILEGGQISCKNIQTERFDENEFFKNYSQINNIIQVFSSECITIDKNGFENIGKDYLDKNNSTTNVKDTTSCFKLSKRTSEISNVPLEVKKRKRKNTLLI